MMIIEAEGKRVAAMVDELLGQATTVVVKNLETNYAARDGRVRGDDPR